MKHKTWMQLRNAMEAVLADHSFDEVTVDMLTRQAGITRQAFYYYYHSLPEYVDDLLRLELMNLLAERASAGELLYQMLKNEEDLHVILKKLCESSYQAETDRMIRECIRKAVTNRSDPETRPTCLEYVLYGLLKDRIEEKNTDPKDVVYRDYVGALSTILRLH